MLSGRAKMGRCATAGRANLDFEAIRRHCLSLPHATEDIQWDHDLLFRIGAKMFAALALEPSHGVSFSVKCSAREFTELTERPGIIPAPYLARYNWIGLQSLDALEDELLRRLIEDSYQMVRAKLPKKIQSRFDPIS